VQLQPQAREAKVLNVLPERRTDCRKASCQCDRPIDGSCRRQSFPRPCGESHGV